MLKMDVPSGSLKKRPRLEEGYREIYRFYVSLDLSVSRSL
jgi:predicted component of viral defense system (DUF524 family)